MQNRREFLGGATCLGAAFAATGIRGETRAPVGKERLRFGVLSDIHIATTKQLPYFEKALRKFAEWKVDAVLACGDLADYGLEQQLQLVADTWFKVFPDGKGSDGRKVVNLMHYGDHDMQDARYVDRPDAVEAWPDTALRHKSVIFNNDRKAVWERCFREPWEQIALKEVKGYPFILSHFTRGEPDNKSGNNVPGLDAFMESHTFDPAKPVFYSQHRIPKNTACGPHAWGQEDGKTTKLFEKHPNLIAFCGHCHMCGAFEKSIWQGAFTCVQVPSLSYSVTMGGRENGYCGDDRTPPAPAKPAKCMAQHSSGVTHQGFLCKVRDDAVVITRWEFEHDLPLGPDWIIPISSFRLPAAERPFAFANRTKTMPAPEFTAGATVKVLKPVKGKDRAGETHEMTPVEFPPALSTAATPHADDYEISLELKQGEVERVLVQKRVYSPRYLYGEKMDTENVRCLFTEEEMPKGWLLRFSVRPANAFGIKGTAISSEWRKQA